LKISAHKLERQSRTKIPFTAETQRAQSLMLYISAERTEIYKLP
jgi:hypothetical protein